MNRTPARVTASAPGLQGVLAVADVTQVVKARALFLSMPHLLGGTALALDALIDQQALTGAFYFLVLGAGLMTAIGAARSAGDDRRSRAWWFLAMGWGSLIASTVTFVVAGIGATDRTMVNQYGLLIGIVLRLGFIAALFLALLTLNDMMTGWRLRRRMALDMLTVLGGGWMLIWYFILDPVLTGAQAALFHLQWELAILPLAEVGLIVGAATVLVRGSSSGGRRPMMLLLMAAVMWFVTDCVSTAIALNPHVTIPVRMNNVLQLAPMVLTVSAAAEQWRVHRRGAQGLAAARIRPVIWTPYVALIFGFALLAYVAFSQDPYPWTGLVLGTAMMTLGVAARQFSVLNENRAMATTDALTGLSNRARLHETLTELDARHRPSRRRWAVLLIDLDDFKPVNDTLGHEAGDQVLVHVAGALRRSVRSTDLAARLGGDEFALVLTDVDNTEHAVLVAERVLEALRAPVEIHARPVRVGASIGIAAARDAGEDADADGLLREADQAMYEAKRAGGNTWKMFRGGVDTRTEEAHLREELRLAVQLGQLRVAYQPVVLLATSRLTSIEALVRWQHPTRGLLAPGAFLAAAENTRLGQEIDLWVLREATRQVRAWQADLEPGRGLRLNTNLSASQLSRPDLAAEVVSILQANDFDPHDLVLEITETSVFSIENALRQCAILRGAGVRIALDDFGTGHSSLEKLMRMPIDVIKLDRCFVPTDDEPARTAIAEAVVRLAGVLNLETVSEGIEDAEQAARMLELGYTYGQGYYFSRPVPGAELRELLGVTAGLPLGPEAPAPSPSHEPAVPVGSE